MVVSNRNIRSRTDRFTCSCSKHYIRTRFWSRRDHCRHASSRNRGIVWRSCHGRIIVCDIAVDGSRWFGNHWNCDHRHLGRRCGNHDTRCYSRRRSEKKAKELNNAVFNTPLAATLVSLSQEDKCNPKSTFGEHSYPQVRDDKNTNKMMMVRAFRVFVLFGHLVAFDRREKLNTDAHVGRFLLSHWMHGCMNEVRELQREYTTQRDIDPGDQHKKGRCFASLSSAPFTHQLSPPDSFFPVFFLQYGGYVLNVCEYAFSRVLTTQ
ncbi:hypothetical protein B0O80DRAFT_287577 [Mortierella sp. GBAus27b]|nr:hypothetical protein B0O80DRAFT_287577 [Mortierella sp. GBAus27b]